MDYFSSHVDCCISRLWKNVGAGLEPLKGGFGTRPYATNTIFSRKGELRTRGGWVWNPHSYRGINRSCSACEAALPLPNR